MTLKEAIERYTSNAEYERIHGNLQGCLDFRQLAEWLKDYERLLEQEPCDTDTCKVAKAYMNEWDKPNNSDEISRQAVLDEAFEVDTKEYGRIDVVGVDAINSLPPVTPQPKTGHWIQTNEFFINQDGQFIYKFICSECKSLSYFRKSNKKAIGANVCPDCGCRMIEPQESEDKK